MQFIYTANKDDKTVHGRIEAVSREAAINSLRQQKMRPIVIKAVKGKQKTSFSLFKKKVKQRDLVIFTRQLSTMISAGVPLDQAIHTLQTQAGSPQFAQIIGEIAKDVQAGSPLGDSFARFPDVFSDVFVNMVKAGEAGGILDDILKRLAAQVEQEASMRKKIKSAMTYPMVILSVTVVAFFGIMLFVIPKISKIMKDLGGEDAELPIYTQALLGLSDFITQYFVFILLLLVIGAYGARRYIKTEKGKYQFHQLLLKIPVINTLIVKVAVARFARTFASLMSAGVNVLDALEVTGGAIGNKVIEAELKEAAKEVKNGKQLSVPLAKSSHFPPIVGQMLAVGEETGKIDEILVKVADFYEEEVSAVIDGLASIIEPVMIIFLGGAVGLIAASVMGPIANLSKNIGTN